MVVINSSGPEDPRGNSDENGASGAKGRKLPKLSF